MHCTLSVSLFCPSHNSKNEKVLKSLVYLKFAHVTSYLPVLKPEAEGHNAI